MVDGDPALILQDFLSVAKIWHAVAGLYFWEFVTTLDYEWNIIRRHRPRWPIWIYSTTRLATAISLAMVLYGIDVLAPYDCEVLTILQLSFGCLSIATSSFLIVLRIFAIWNKKKIIMAIAAGVLGINVILLIRAVVQTRVVRGPLTICLMVNRHIPELSVFGTLVADIVLLLIMSFGLLRRGSHWHERNLSSLGHLLWKQGLIWLLVAIVTELIPAVLISLDLDVPFKYMFLPLPMVTLSIAATQIHRGLVDDDPVRRNKQLSDPISLPRNDRVEWKRWRHNSIPIAPTLPTHMKVAVDRTYEQEQSQYGSFNSVEGQPGEKLTRLPGLDENTENDVGSDTSPKI